MTKLNHISGATTFGRAHTPRQDLLPLDVCDCLDKVRLPLPEPGAKVPLRQLDAALAGEPLEMRFRAKRALLQIGLL
jgi:hypothetical protein